MSGDIVFWPKFFPPYKFLMFIMFINYLIQYSDAVVNSDYTTRIPLARSSNFSPSGMSVLAEWLDWPTKKPALLHWYY